MSALYCTAQSPMPEVRDQIGQHWVHVDARPVEFDIGGGRTERVRTLTGTLHRCPHCRQEFYQRAADACVDTSSTGRRW